VDELRAQAITPATIEGRVLNVRTGEFVENARITIEGTPLETFTDSDGTYRLGNVPVGAVKLKAFYTGLPVQTSEVVVGASETVQRDISLGSETGAEGGTVKLSQFVVSEAREMDAAAVAINEQRFAGNIKTVVSTDDFGSTAESNVGEFLKFMPGLNVNFNAGNPREVSIAGVPTDNVPITIDGFNVASTGSGATGRAVALDFLGVSNASRVEVNYSPTPESQGMALAGSVNVVPRSSFGRSRPVFNGSIYISMRDDERDFNKTPGPRRDPTRKVHPGFDFSWIVPVNKRLGFSLSAGSSTIYTAQKVMGAQWRGVNVATNGTAFPNTSVDRPYLTQYAIRVTGTNYERRQFGVSIDYKLAPNDRLTFSYQWSSFSSNIMQRNLLFNITQVASFSPTSTRSTPGGGNLQMSTANGTDRLNRTHMPMLTWRHEGPIWRAEAGAGLSFATNHVRGVDKGFFNTELAQRTAVTVNFDEIFYLRPGTITVTDVGGAPVDPYNLGTYAMSSFTAERRNPSDEQTTMYANLRRDFYGRVPLTLKGGVDVRRLTRQYRNHTLPLSYVGPDGRTSTTPLNSDDSAAPFLDASFSQRTSPYGFPKIQWVSPEVSYDIYQAHPNWFVPDYAAAYTTLTNSSKRAEELISAAYVRGDLQFFQRRLKLIGGLRAEQTNIEAHALLNDPTRNVQRDAAGRPILVNGRTVAITTDPLQSLQLTRIERGARTDKEFLNLFPNINASYNLRENLIVRSAYFYSIGRPDLGQYASGITLPNTDNPPAPTDRIVVSNAGIKPWTAKSVNVRLEYYFKGVGQISIGAFRRDFKNFFGGVTFLPTPEFLALYGLDPNTYGLYQVQTQENVQATVQMTGVDMNYKQALTFLPHWARGVQVFANATAMRAQGPAIASFTGLNLIPRSGSWGIGLTREKFNLHVNWNYRGRQRQGLIAASQGIEPGTYNWQSKRMQIDVLGERKLTRHLALFANLRNVGDGPLDNKAAGSNTPKYAQFLSRSAIGSQWTFGLKGTW
jgi:iron complex outermembrane recepter protein